MKYLNIHILNDNGNMVYPVGYQAEIGNFAKDHLYYKDAKGEDNLLLLIEDTDFNPGMMRPDVTEMTEVTAVEISNANETRTETITDEAKLRRLELKAQLGIALTTEERDAVDPTKPNAVFAVSKILADRVADLKSEEAVKIAK